MFWSAGMFDTNKCSVRLTVFSDGERYPLLLDAQGSPLWYQTLFTTTQFRNSSKAPNTMLAVLSALRVLMYWAQKNDIDLESRFARREYLNEQELESLCRHSQTKTLEPEVKKQNIIRVLRRVETARGLLRVQEARVGSNTQYTRISYIAEYLDWLAIRLVERDARHVDGDVLVRIKRMTGSLRKRRPQKVKGSAVFARRGLTENQQVMLLELVKPESSHNPFSKELRSRNQLIVWLLYYLGLRVGELLALRVSDFDLQQNTLLVARRHDNPDDPRTNQPVVKTIDRRIPLTESLVKAVSDYVLHERCRIPSVKRQHDFLVVTHQSGPYKGQPLSGKGLTKMFLEIQAALPDEFGARLTPHILRHTANDRFSALMDQKNVKESEEQKLRSYIFGWKEGSGTAATYTRRHIEKKAHEAALQLQNRNKENLSG